MMTLLLLMRDVFAVETSENEKHPTAFTEDVQCAGIAVI
jgi:hypothetical protein